MHLYQILLNSFQMGAALGYSPVATPLSTARHGKTIVIKADAVNRK